ncbi:thiamine biosynthesis protein ThiS [bacterium F11]|nr:thiamine biosynthesis protein ThiS [bacterium F11]
MTSVDQIVQVNGKKENIKSGISIREFLQKKGINPNTVACELNMKIIRRNFLGDTILSEGDELEIIQMIGGG